MARRVSPRPDGAGLVGRLAGQTRPVLLVVDYAETHTALTSTLLTTLEERATRTPIRLLLVARGGGDWWEELTGRHPLAENGQTVTLPPVEDSGPDRTALFTDAASTFARRLADLDPAVDWADRFRKVQTGIPDLSDPGFGLVLAVHMAALTALLDQPTSGDGGSPEQVADRLLQHEKRYWTDTARTRGIDRSAGSLEQAIAAATLCGATNPDEAAAALARLPAFTGTDGTTHDLRNRTAHWLAGLYPPAPDQTGQFWGGISPDRLAEHFLARHLTGNPDLTEHLLAGASTGQTYQALTVLNRATPTHPDLDPLLPALLATDPATRAPIALRVAIEAADHRPAADALTTVTPHLDRPTLTSMIDSLPEYSLRLLDLAATLQHAHTLRIRDHIPPHPPRRWPLPRRRHTPVDTTHLADLAASLNNQSVRLGGLGRREETLTAINDAVTIHRRLAADRPDAFLPDLIRSLNNLADLLRAIGRHAEAQTIDDERNAL